MERNINVLLSDTFLASIWKLDKTSQRKVQQRIKSFSVDIKGNGFQVHSLDRTNCDPSFKSARIDRDLRLIFSSKGKYHVLLYVDHHDAAYNWAQGKYLHSSQFGSLYIHNEVRESNTVEKSEHELSGFEEGSTSSLLAQQEVTLKELYKLGLSDKKAKVLYEITDEDEFMEVINDLLPEIQEGLIDIVTGTKTISQVYSELEDQSVSGEDDFIKALAHKDSKRRFYLLEDIDELEEITKSEFTYWKLFLHPRQESLVKKKFNGPALIEGGPGTGKTVVGIHRAVYLATHVFTHEEKILICTYSRKLAGYLQEKVNLLLKQKSVPDNKIEVRGVDSLVNRLIRKYNLHDYEVNPSKIVNLFDVVHNELKPTRPVAFFRREYEEVIQRNGIYKKEEYMKIGRKGQGHALNPHERERVWKFFDRLLQLKLAQKVIDFEDQARIVLRAIRKKVISPPYASIIIDEAQDLSPIKLKLLSELCYSKKNNLLILSDTNQRIFLLNGWKKDTEINIVGRTYYLSLNYRTTKQIREFADQQFIKTRLDLNHLREYKSLLGGPEPVVKEFSSKKKQYYFLIRSVSKLLESGVKPSDICIISPTEAKSIAAIFDYEEIPSTILSGNIYTPKNAGIGICTLQGCKGLEFRYVFIPNFDEENVTESMVTNDEWYEMLEEKRNECLRYVAITRARDEVIISLVED